MIYRERIVVPWSQGRFAAPTGSPLDGRRCDVGIVGGGIVGLTTALRLAQAGLDVVLLEAQAIGSGETGRSTAHLSTVSDNYPDTLIRKFDRDVARTFSDGMKLAVSAIEETVKELAIDCGFARVPALLLAQDDAQMERLAQIEAALAQIDMPGLRLQPGKAAAGIDVLPLTLQGVQAGLALPHQGRLDPQRYAHGLAHAALELGVSFYEQTRVVEVGGSTPHAIRTADGATLTADVVVIAAHVPFNNRVLLHTKQAAFRTYVIGLPVLAGSIPDALYWDLDDPYHYARLIPGFAGPGHDLLIVGGEDHKTGRAPLVADPFAALTAYARQRFGVAGEPTHQWSGQIMEPVDALPLIGANPGTRTEFVATGFGGDGITGGTLAAHIIVERVLGKTTPWDEMLAPARFAAAHGARDYLAQNVDFPAHLVSDRLRPETEDRPIACLHAGEGGLFKLGGRRLAVSRLANGHFAAVQPACSHLGCHVHWNGVEASWDCPCHGSRFGQDGQVLNGPAAAPLPAVPLEEVLAEADDEKPRTAAFLAEDWAAT